MEHSINKFSQKKSHDRHHDISWDFDDFDDQDDQDSQVANFKQKNRKHINKRERENYYDKKRFKSDFLES